MLDADFVELLACDTLLSAELLLDNWNDGKLRQLFKTFNEITYPAAKNYVDGLNSGKQI